ncbi:MAG: sulfurtransferase [Candidatus Caldarchaeum sp.]|nr:sulfurtransferase [Candidatus Caldarchaeum sp.]
MSYANPDVLADVEWLKKSLGRPDLAVIEVDYDPKLAYEQGHIPGALLIDWRKDMNKQNSRDIIDAEEFERLMSGLGVSNDTHVVLYGDYNNWFATFAFWVFEMYGHKKLQLLNGGRKKWIDSGGELSKELPKPKPSTYKVQKTDSSSRILLDELMREKIGSTSLVLVDVRSPAEFKGEITAPPEYPNEHAQRGGHIPGAINIPWGMAIKEDGTFKPFDELQKLYGSKGVDPDKDVVAYCRIGERASVTWFVLKHLLGYKRVRVYDGSWTEWGNLVRFPIEK